MQGRPDADAVTVNLEAAETHEGLQLSMAKGARLKAKITGVQATPGMRVSLSQEEEMFRNAFNLVSGFQQGENSAELAKDGSFTISGLEPGKYILNLLTPQVHPGLPALQTEIDTVRFGKKDLQRKVDVSELMPGVIRGKITVRGAPIPLSRLLVTARPRVDKTDIQAMLQMQGGDHMAMVAADGSFSLKVNAGKHSLQVLDALTGIPLLESRHQMGVNPNDETSCVIIVDPVLVKVHLQPMEESGQVVASHLEAIVESSEEDGQELQLIQVMRSSGMATDLGVSLTDGKREVHLFLPPAPTTLRVYSNANALRETENLEEPEPIGEHEFTPELGKINRVKIKVDPPEKLGADAGSEDENR